MCRPVVTVALVFSFAVACGAAQQANPTPDRQLVRARDPVCTGDASVSSPVRVVRYLDTDEPIPEATNSGLHFIFPMADPQVTSSYGVRTDPLDCTRQRMHRGTDFRGASGTPVYATEAGHALMAGYCDRGTGNCVVLEHANGWRSQYFHLRAVHIRAGSWVARGDHIGDVGSTGRSTGPHLHFQLSRDGVDVDPMEHIGPSVEQASATAQD